MSKTARLINQNTMADVQRMTNVSDSQFLLLRALLICLKSFDRSFQVNTQTWHEVKYELLSTENMIAKRIELVPIGLDETIKSFKRGERKKIIWREVGFIKYFNRFKKVFASFKKQ